jgi:uncharacterized protein (DUF305 family)
VGAVVAGALLAGCSGGGDDGGSGDGAGADDGVRTVQPGAPGGPSRELSDDEAASVTAPEHTSADTAFMQHMIVHHRQALDMAALVDERTERDDLPVLAQRIIETQETEIAQIETWLTERDEEIPAEDALETDHEAHAGMPGMAAPEQLDELEAAEGEAFDRLFLDLMIAHHQGALTMVVELREDGGGVEPAADRFARDVDADQNIEITRMQELLATLG